MRLPRLALALSFAVCLPGCGLRAPSPASSQRPAPAPAASALLVPPAVSVVTGSATGAAKQWGGYEWTSGHRTTIADAFVDPTSAQALGTAPGLHAAPGAAVRLRIAPVPDHTTLALVAGPAVGPSASPPEHGLAFTAPAAPGTYDYRLDATWSGGRYATYFFRLAVG